jgi:FKBP-type peptidyl-prolyl cis-trans isomerases 1
MNFAWAKKAALVAAVVVTGTSLSLGLSGCSRGASGDDPAAASALEAQSWMRANGHTEGVVTLPSGLQYKIVTSGPVGGKQPDRNDLVRVDYEGSLTNGEVFDSTFGRGLPSVMTPSEVIPAWTEALQLMRPGDEWLLYVPPELGYGESGRPPVIPGNAVLVFRLRLLDVAQTPGTGSGVGEANG